MVDGLSVRILADNHTDRYSVPVATPGMKIDRTGGTERPGVPPASTWRAEWGLSMFAESVLGDETKRVMIDFGYTAEALLGNMGASEGGTSIETSIVRRIYGKRTGLS